jgi:hypothetical protein
LDYWVQLGLVPFSDRVGYSTSLDHDIHIFPEDAPIALAHVFSGFHAPVVGFSDIVNRRFLMPRFHCVFLLRVLLLIGFRLLDQFLVLDGVLSLLSKIETCPVASAE